MEIATTTNESTPPQNSTPTTVHKSPHAHAQTLKSPLPTKPSPPHPSTTSAPPGWIRTSDEIPQKSAEKSESEPEAPDTSDSEEEDEQDLYAQRVAQARAHVAIMVKRVRELDRARAHVRDHGGLLRVPDEVWERLLPHQKAGLRFLCEQVVSGLGTVLADEQGLGKTIQAIALLQTVSAHASTVTSTRARTEWKERVAHLLPRMLSDSNIHQDMCPPTHEDATALPNPRILYCSTVLPKSSLLSSALAGASSSSDSSSEEEEDEEEEMDDAWTPLDAMLGGPHVIVVPTSTVGNWRRELEEWAPELRVWELVGTQAGRRELLQKYASYARRRTERNRAVILTTYTMVDSEATINALSDALGRRGAGILILDEAHLLKNPTTTRFGRITSIRAARKVLLTGTPVQNNLNELLSLLAVFLSDIIDVKSDHVGVRASEETAWTSSAAGPSGPSGRTEWDAFCDAVRAELSSTTPKSTTTSTPSTPKPPTLALQTPHGIATLATNSDEQRQDNNDNLARIQETFGRFFLRRTKDMVLDLPPKTVSIVEPELSASQEAIYGTVRRQLRKEVVEEEAVLVGGVNDAGSIESVPTHTGMLASLRKVANHPLLLRSRYSDAATLVVARVIAADEEGGGRRLGSERPAIWKEMTQAALAMWGYEKTVEPIVSQDRPLLIEEGRFPVILSMSFLRQWAGGENRLVRIACELLRTWSDMDIADVCEEHECLWDLRLGVGALFDAGKLRVVRRLATRATVDSKVLVFSQFTRVLDLLERVLDRDGIRFIRLDGSTKSSERQALIDVFNNDPLVVVFLLSTRAGGIGLNLTAACRVVIYDPDMNPANDRQAEDRCHRIGQTRPVQVLKLAARGTVERRILDLAANKALLHRVISTAGSKRLRDPTASIEQALVQFEKE